MDVLTIKNLIGRSGRSTSLKNTFDHGYTVVKKKNLETFKKTFKQGFNISETSLLDQDLEKIPEDMKDIVEALKNDTFDDDLHLTKSQLERLVGTELDEDIKYVLDNLLKDGEPVTGQDYYALTEYKRNKIKTAFKNIYIKHLRRTQLSKAEASVLSAAIPIMLWHIQGRSFSEIVSIRHAFLSQRDRRREILSRISRKEITSIEGVELIKKELVRYTPIPSPLPDIFIRPVPLFPEGTSIGDLEYDKIVYDTYDFLDKVVSLSLTDPICAALELYYNRTQDERANALKSYVRYGTNDEKEIWLLRYGFGFEEIDWLKDHVEKIDDSRISFSKTITDFDSEQMAAIERYL